MSRRFSERSKSGISRRAVSAVLLGATANAVGAAIAMADDVPMDEVIVWGRAISLIGTADTASEGVVGYDDFKTRPISRVGELVEVIPGLVATQHSGSGKANQYFLRGFNLDHGTDFAVSFDGQPVNFRTHGHGQGYLDLNFIIPEIVERVEFRKGPYHADAGDFSLAASADFVTYDSLEDGFIEVMKGEFDFTRIVAAGSTPLAGGSLLIAAEGQLYDGPWELDEDLQKINLFGKYTGSSGPAEYELSLSYYDSDWTSTDQIPLRAVNSGLIDRFGFIDPDLGGETKRFSINGLSTIEGLGGTTTLNAYLINYDFSLFSNFTYFAADPINGDEFEQRDRRWVYGGSVDHQNHFHIGETRFDTRIGGEIRYDDIRDVGLFNTVARQRIGTVRRDEVQQFSVGGFAEVQVSLTETLRLTGGVRADYYDADVNSLSLPANSGQEDDSIVTPTVSLAWRAIEPLEFYANYGQGFHSNDARGVTTIIDPVEGAPVEPVDLLVRGEGAEAGARWQRGPFTASIAAFWLELDSELVFVGDAGTTEPNDATRRIGFEGSAFLQATDWLVFDVSGGYTDAEFRDAPADENEIPGAVKSVVGAGAVATFGDFTGSLRLRHFGSAPLIEDGSVSSEPTDASSILGPATRSAGFSSALMCLTSSIQKTPTSPTSSRASCRAKPRRWRTFTSTLSSRVRCAAASALAFKRRVTLLAGKRASGLLLAVQVTVEFAMEMAEPIFLFTPDRSFKAA